MEDILRAKSTCSLDRDKDEGGDSEKNKKKYSALYDASWLREQFLELLGIPVHTRLATLRDHADRVRRLAVADGRLYSAGEGNTVMVYSCEDQSLVVPTLRHDGEAIYSLAVHDGKIYCGTRNATIVVFDASTHDRLVTLTAKEGGHSSAIQSLIFNNQEMYSTGDDYTIKVWDTTDPDHSLITTLEEEKWITFLAIYEKRLYSGSFTTIRVWDCDKDHSLIATLEGHDDNVVNIVHDEGKMYSVCEGGKLLVWDVRLEVPQLVVTLRAHWESGASLLVHNGKLYSGGCDGVIKVFKTSDNSEVATMMAHYDAVMCLAVFDNKLYASGRDDHISVWSCEDQTLITKMKGHRHLITAMAIENDTLYSSSLDTTVMAWKLR